MTLLYITVGAVVLGYLVVRAAMAASASAGGSKRELKIIKEAADRESEAEDILAEPLPDSAADEWDKLRNDRS